MFKSALIGYTGFVGGNILRQQQFQNLYNSKNIDDICGNYFDLVVCAGVSAVKWLANKEPEKDWDNIKALITKLQKVHAKEFILISTVDVYPNPIDVDEDFSINLDECAPYGKHRRLLEEFVVDNFERITIVRLPGIFGEGLKKNIIYDFLNNKMLDCINSENVFQFYDLKNVWKDINIARNNNLKLINFATEPTSVKEIASVVLGSEFNSKLAQAPVLYNMRTKYSALFNSQVFGYIYTKKQVLQDLRVFVVKYRNQGDL